MYVIQIDKIVDVDKYYKQLKKEQMGSEGELLSSLLAGEELKDLAVFEADLGVKRNEILFKINNEIEATRNRLKQAEQLVERLKKHLNQLEGINHILTKK